MSEALSVFFFRHMPSVRMNVWLKLSVMLENGMNVFEAVGELYERSVRFKEGFVLTGVFALLKRRLRDGLPFAQAVSGLAGPAEVLMISAGEKSGRLAGTLTKVRDLMEQTSSMKQTVFAALAYPATLLAAAFGVLYLFAVQIIPQIASLSVAPVWSGQAALLVNVCAWVRVLFFPVLASLAVLLVGFTATLGVFDGPVRIALDRFFPYSVPRMVAESAFFLSLAALSEAGMRLEDAVSALSKESGPWMARRLRLSLANIRRGHDLGEAFFLTGTGFPGELVCADLSLFSKFKSFEPFLTRFSRHLMEDAKRRLSATMRSLFVALLLSTGAITVFMATGVMAMQQQISAQASNLR